MSKMKIVVFAVGVIVFAVMVPMALAADGDDLDVYKLRLGGVWWFSQPSGYFQGHNHEGYFDLNRDFGFGDYSTFSGLVDWRFKRKHHLLFGVSPVTFNRRRTIGRTIEFQGQTFDVGASVNAQVRSLAFSPGYQYDIFRRSHWYLGVAIQAYLLSTSAKLTGVGTVNNVAATRTASGSFFAPLPVFGPTFRWYPRSTRFSVDGTLQGMYFFGYGNFVAARGALNFGLTRHFGLKAGYQLGSRLSIHGTTDNVGIRLVQKGPIAGIEASW